MKNNFDLRRFISIILTLSLVFTLPVEVSANDEAAKRGDRAGLEDKRGGASPFRGANQCSIWLDRLRASREGILDLCESAGLVRDVPSCRAEAIECEKIVKGVGGLAEIVKNPDKVAGLGCPALASLTLDSLKEQKKELEASIDKESKEIEKLRKAEKDDAKKLRDAEKDARKNIAELRKDINKKQGEKRKAQSDAATDAAEKDGEFRKDLAEKRGKQMEAYMTKLDDHEKILAEAESSANAECKSFAQKMFDAMMEKEPRVYRSYRAKQAARKRVAGFRNRMDRHCKATEEYRSRVEGAAALQKNKIQRLNEQAQMQEQANKKAEQDHARAMQGRQMAALAEGQAIDTEISNLQKEQEEERDELGQTKEDLADSREGSERRLRGLTTGFDRKKAKLAEIEKAIATLRGKSLPMSGSNGNGKVNAARLLQIPEATDTYIAIQATLQSLGDCNQTIKGTEALKTFMKTKEMLKAKREGRLPSSDKGDPRQDDRLIQSGPGAQ